MFSLDVAKWDAYPNSLITERLKRKLVLLELEGSVNVSQLLEFGQVLYTAGFWQKVKCHIVIFRYQSTVGLLNLFVPPDICTFHRPL